MKLQRRSKIKVSVLFFLPVSFLALHLFISLVILALTEKLQVVGMANGTPSKTEARKLGWASTSVMVNCALTLPVAQEIYLSLHTPVRPSISLTVCLSVFLFVLLSVLLSLSVCSSLSVYPSDRLSVHLFVWLSVLLSVFLFVFLSVCSSLYPSVCAFVCLSVCQPICLSVCLSVRRNKRYFKAA